MNRISVSFCLLGATQLLLALSAPYVAAQSEPSSIRPTFFCGLESGTPTTMVRTAAGDSEFIRWTSVHFSSSGWTPEQRCKVVSERLQSSSDRGNLKFLTTGRMKDQSVICSANTEGGRCLDLLYTLKPGQDPVQALRGLVSTRQGLSGPVSETSTRIYLSVTKLIGSP